MLIVNADDWGRTRQATDAILSCLEAGTVTSASAMVHMVDSARAAELATDQRLPAGLHLNLTEPYSARGVPIKARDRQARLVRSFKGNRLSMWTYNPWLAPVARDCIRDQIEAFVSAYGREPSHINGHHHVHTSPTVLLSGALARGQKVRRTFTFLPGERSVANRLARSGLNHLLARRFRGTRYFFHLESFVRAAERGLVSPDASIEVMTHPEWSEECALLMSPRWKALISRFELCSYDSLR